MSPSAGSVSAVRPVSGGSIDRTPPTAPGTPVVTNAAASGTATITFTAATDNVGVTGYAVYLDGGAAPVESGNALSFNLAEIGPGSHSVVVRAYDAAGNYSESSGSTSFVIPNQSGLQLATGIAAAGANTAAIQAALSAGMPINITQSDVFYLNYDTFTAQMPDVILSKNTHLLYLNGKSAQYDLPQCQIFGSRQSVAMSWAGQGVTLTPSASSAATPTAFETEGTQDIIIAAQVGDVIALEINCMPITTPAGSGLVVSVWSVGGKLARDWKSGVSGLQSVAGCLTVPAANSSPTIASNVRILNKVLASDINSNGQCVFRLFGANAVTGAYSYTVNPNAATGQFCAKNLRTNNESLSESIQTICQYPGGTAGVNFNFTMPSTTQTAMLIDPAGSLSIKIPAASLDMLEAVLALAVNDNSEQYLIASVGGSVIRSWNTGAEYPSVTAMGLAENGIWIANSTAQEKFQSRCINRVSPTDIDANGDVTLAVYCFQWRGSGAAITISGSNSASINGFSFYQVTKYRREKNWAILPLTNTLGESVLGTTAQEPSVWRDNSGVYNMLFTAGTLFTQTWWATAPSPAGPWTVSPAGEVLSTGMYENGVYYDTASGLLYVYYPSGGGIGYAVGASPATLVSQSTPALAASQISSVMSTSANSAVTKGPGGLYFMLVEGESMAGSYWEMCVATATSPAGPFEFLAGPLTTLQVAANGTYGGPWLQYVGDYFVVYYHAAPGAGTVPTYTYSATSQDCITWTPGGVNALGLVSPVAKPYTELKWNGPYSDTQTADPSYLLDGDNLYLFNTEQETGSGQIGGITVSDPTRFSIAIPTPYV